MAGYPPPGDPYFPNQGNNGWIEDDPQEDPEEDSEEESSDGTDSEPEVYNPPQGVQRPVARQHFQGPTPTWGEELHRWSQQQGQRPLFG